MPDYCPACYGRKVYCRGCKGYHCQCSWTGKHCRTWYRKFLNETTEHRHRNGRFEQRVRLYGDYLYHQDRDKFEMQFKEWQAI